MREHIDTFMAITGCDDSAVAENFVEMAGGDLETAISLFYEHGPATNTSNNNAAASSIDAADDDISLAQRLQNEENQVPEPRAPDQAVHERLVDDFHTFPGTFGGIGGAFSPLANPDELIYGRARAGIFNQRETLFGEEDDDDHMEGMTEGQRRLAQMFRPPFDIMEKLDLDSAKLKANKEKKWVLINIQDVSDFQCQALNRDFWKSSTIKEVVKDNFVFLQYQKDSRSGQEYCNFYPFENFPHIAILDPITGERVKMWSGIPKVSKWCDEVYDFLNEFSIDPTSVNPTVSHKSVVDPNTLSEEKQLEYAIQQSLGRSKDNAINLDSDEEMSEGGGADDPISIDDEITTAKTSAPLEPKVLTDEQKLSAIKSMDHEEPSTPTTTRIQIRLGDGTRVVKKFDAEDQVRVIYEVVKHQFADKIGSRFFTLLSQRENLLEKLDMSIADAGLKNASILLDIVQEDDEE